MLSEKEKSYAREVLALITESNLFSLVATVTNNLVQPCDVNEAIECILQHSVCAESLLSRKKVQRDVLFQYLHQKKVNVDAYSEKKELVLKVLELWNEDSLEMPVRSSVQPEITVCAGPFPYVQELAIKFSEWFYQLLNNSVNGHSQARLEAIHCWPNCNLAVKMESTEGCLEQCVSENSSEAVRVLCTTCAEHRLFFNPNLTCDGVRGQVDSHGLVTVVTCGTLHVDNTCVGVFEQCFGLIKDPHALNNWKIKTMDLRMKAMSVSSMPTIQSGGLFNRLCVTNHEDKFHEM